MLADLNQSNIELNPLVLEIIKLATSGMTDSQIGECLGKPTMTIYNYRHKYGIRSGSYYRTQIERPKQARKRKPKYNFKPLHKLKY